MKRMLKWVGLTLGALMLIGFLIPDETAARWKAEREAKEAAEAPARAASVVTAGTEAAAGTATAPSREKSGGISMENYLRLQTGMTIAEVEAILGGPGEELSRVELEGLPTTVSYKWQRWTGANIILMFQGGKMNMKAQAGL